VSDPRFEVLGARAEPYALAPTLMVRLRVSEASGARIQSIPLKVQIMVEPQRRHYTPLEEERLLELFGEPARWGDTLRTMLWTHASVIVPAFQGATEVEFPLLCSYDFEVASSKFFHALDDGGIPLLLQFSGSVFVQGDRGITVDRISWDRESSFHLPVRTWRDLMNIYYPGGAWLRLRRDTFDALHRFRGREVLTTWDETIDRLLERAGAGAREPA
jgi:hypothetical protein